MKDESYSISEEKKWKEFQEKVKEINVIRDIIGVYFFIKTIKIKYIKKRKKKIMYNQINMKVCHTCKKYIIIFSNNYISQKKENIFNNKHSKHATQIINKNELNNKYIYEKL